MTQLRFPLVFAATSAVISSQFCIYCHALSTPASPPSPFGSTARNIATQVLQGAGPAAVDMNQYNLPSLSNCEQEWTATTVQKADESQPFVRLAAKSERELYVDTATVVFPILPGKGLGIELAELAGGRDDGLGITIVTGLVEGGSADSAKVDILPGDSLSKVSLIRRKLNGGTPDGAKGFSEIEEEFSCKTECLSYDSTVAAIQSLPPLSDGTQEAEGYYAIRLKRLRRKPVVSVKLQYPPSQNLPDETIKMFAGENLRLGMLVRGVKLNDELAKRFDTKSSGNCGAGGLCRTCAVAVQGGGDLLNPQRVAEKQMLADNPRWRLACKAIVGFGMKEGELKIRVNPRQWD